MQVRRAQPQGVYRHVNAAATDFTRSASSTPATSSATPSSVTAPGISRRSTKA